MSCDLNSLMSVVAGDVVVFLVVYVFFVGHLHSTTNENMIDDVSILICWMIGGDCDSPNRNRTRQDRADVDDDVENFHFDDDVISSLVKLILNKKRSDEG